MSPIIRALLQWITPRTKVKQKDEESTSLLGDDHQSLRDNQSPVIDSTQNYGSAKPDSSEESLEPDNKSSNDEEKQDEETAKEDDTFMNYMRRFCIFIPYVWPYKNRRLQLSMIGVVLCVTVVRFLNVFAPRQLGIVVENLGPGHLPTGEILIYIILNLMQSSPLLDCLRNYLWYPVEMNAHQTITTSAFSHVMGLSKDYHDNKKSGELYKSIEQGTAIAKLLETALFEVLPLLIDLIVACAYLSYLFGGYMVVIVGGSIFFYLWASKYFMLKLVGLYREVAAVSRAETQRLLDSVGGWISVTYFNNFHYELGRYTDAVAKTIQTSWKSMNYRYGARSIKDSILQLGFVGALFIAAYRVSVGRSSVGNFVQLLSYWAQFTSPLAYISYLQQDLQQNLVNAEELLKLLRTEPTIKSGPAVLALDGGAVRFDSVSFSYDGKKSVIKDLSFSAASGQTIALVGETGSGKSTILSLIFRFYDVQKGSITIDGQDLRDLTLESLRQSIGVVPQDPVLFNDTVMSNVRYSRLEATDEEVAEACKAAAVHEKILSFTNGYSTIVGENGAKLSGGEKQRIAIARAILKDPKIVLLDEATSSVDTQTEHHIQKALRELTKGRTTFVVAHRLSTVMEADVMLVIKGGTIVEQGFPKDLLETKGEFFELWSLQNIAVD